MNGSTVHSIRCTVHYLDNMNLNRTLAYLNSAWNKGSFNADQFYIVKINSTEQLKILNLPYIFEFKRLLISVQISVSKNIAVNLEAMLS